MQGLTLQRQNTSSHGTEGILTLPNAENLFTLELPWHDNEPQISCIPTGIYDCKPRHSKKFKAHYWVTEVAGRSWILIHSGNFAGDVAKGLRSNVQGCILLGVKRGTIAGQKAVLSSKVAMRKFLKVMNNKEFNLEII